MVWRLSDSGRLPVTWTVTVAEAARRAAIRTSQEVYGSDLLPACLHRIETAAGRHLHAHWLPEDRDGDRRIDHLTVYAPGGFCAEARAILRRMERLEVHGAGTVDLLAHEVPDSARPRGRVWISSTPFVGPARPAKGPGRPLRPNYAAEPQLARLIALWRDPAGRPLPRCEITPLADPQGLSARTFRLGRRYRALENMLPRGWFLLSFAAPVTGPLAFGLGAHFGLGAFRTVP